ncbi:MAG TPA: glycosyltransferase family 2 protein [Verrucomicrobiae bacterium]|nr:glycosyltransferase family 2 protein [Verrucomicrobiae bacterium]
MDTPVALLVFNRPEATKRVVAEILQARPPKVLVFADGPRPDQRGDAELISAAKAVIRDAPWECEVLTNYSEVNLGTRYRPATGLDWVFAQVEEAIVLEDDCLPDQSFFHFCDELLEKYRHDERVMMISGDNFMRGQKLSPYSYLFCRYVGIWGWATWRRAWRYYDVDLHRWKALRETRFLEDFLGNEEESRLWRRFFDRIITGESKTWDHQWQFACWCQQGLSIMPASNLVSNIGFGPTAQHYKEFDPKLADVPTVEMEFPLRHPPAILRTPEADDFVFRELLKPYS